MENEIPRGHLSTIILSTLLDGDKYGYEIIKAIEIQTDGSVIVKQPSLYSCLKRMEEQSLISSYWRDSDIGGRRHYYRLTDLGRKQTLEWQKDLISSQKYVKNIFDGNQSQEISKNKTTVLKQENLFSLAEKSNHSISPLHQTELKQDTYVQFNLFEKNIVAQPNENEEYIKNIENKSTNVDEKPYNVRDELYKMRSNSSFSDHIKDEKPKSYNYSPTIYIEDNENETTSQDNTINQSITIDEKDKIDPTINIDYNINDSIDDLNNDINIDQGIFITESISPEELPQVKKIEPSKFETLNIDNNQFQFEKKKNNRDIVDKLYEKANADYKEESTLYKENEYYESYENLFNHFKQNQIKFYAYEKQTRKPVNKLKTQTKINLISYSIFTILSVITSLILFFSTYNYKPLAPIIFFVIPLFIVLFLTVKYYQFKQGIVENYKPVTASLLFQSLIIVITSILLYAINILLNINTSGFILYSATFLFPIIIMLEYLLSTIINIIIQKKKSQN